MNIECPFCNNRLYERKTANGWVCKNWKCDCYWKLGKGLVFDKEGNFDYLQGKYPLSCHKKAVERLDEEESE